MPAQKLDKQHSLKILNMEPTGVSTNSHQQLMSDCDSDAITCSGVENDRGMRMRDISRSKWFTVIILCFVNLINYMDRFTLAGVLLQIQGYFGLGEASGGLLQTAFVLSYMLFAPLFGYLGDRYNRRHIMAFGVFLWSITTLLGSFMENFVGFIIFRALVGIGEASYSTIAPTIISDLFVKDLRSKMLALFYFAIPVGSGLGYIVGSETSRAAGKWQWGLRVTPALGAVAVILILFVMVEPERGEHESEGREQFRPTSWWTDIKELSKNASFMLSTLGFTCVAFVAGALAWWGPTFIKYGIQVQTGKTMAGDEFTFVFGLITMLAGIVGLSLGTFLSSSLKRKFPRADPIICAVGLFVSAPLLTGCTFLVTQNTTGCFVLLFFGQVALNLNWAIVADILLYVVIPTRRSTAEAFQILLSHALGDAGSPYLIGVISESLIANFVASRVMTDTSIAESIFVVNATTAIPLKEIEDKFKSLQYALFTTAFVEVLGGCFFLCTAMYVLRDKMIADQAMSATAKARVSGVDNPAVGTTSASNPQLEDAN